MNIGNVDGRQPSRNKKVLINGMVGTQYKLLDNAVSAIVGWVVSRRV